MIFSAKKLQPLVSNRELLSPLDLSLGAGEFVTLSAASGAGKTRLFETISGINRHYTGSFELHSDLTYLPQAPSLCSSQNAVENALMGSLSGQSWLQSFWGYKDSQVQKALSYLKILGVKDTQSPVSHLSGGEQQRVCLARTLMSPAQLWLLDEPISQLDFETALSCLQLFKSEAKKRNTAVLCVLHQEELIPKIADRSLTWRGKWETQNLNT